MKELVLIFFGAYVLYMFALMSWVMWMGIRIEKMIYSDDDRVSRALDDFSPSFSHATPKHWWKTFSLYRKAL